MEKQEAIDAFTTMIMLILQAKDDHHLYKTDEERDADHFILVDGLVYDILGFIGVFDNVESVNHLALKMGVIDSFVTNTITGNGIMFKAIHVASDIYCDKLNFAQYTLNSVTCPDHIKDKVREQFELN